MRNTDGVTCNDSGCVGKLYWHSDGSVYDQHVPESVVKIEGNSHTDTCVTYGDGGIVDSNCNAARSYVCEFKCPEMAGAQHILCKIVESQ